MATLPNDQYMWIAYLGEVRRVRIVEKGCGDVVFKPKMKPKNPYVVYDEVDEEHFVMGLDDLHHNPREAQIAAAKLAQEHGVEVQAPDDVPGLDENPEEDEEEDGADEEEDDDEGDFDE